MNQHIFLHFCSLIIGFRCENNGFSFLKSFSIPLSDIAPWLTVFVYEKLIEQWLCSESSWFIQNHTSIMLLWFFILFGSEYWKAVVPQKCKHRYYLLLFSFIRFWRKNIVNTDFYDLVLKIFTFHMHTKIISDKKKKMKLKSFSDAEFIVVLTIKLVPICLLFNSTWCYRHI